MGLDVIPEAVARQQGLNLGWRRYFNNHTLNGKSGLFLSTMGITYLIVKTFQFKSYMKQRSITKAEDKKKWAQMLVEMEQWEKNGKKF